MSRRRPGRLPRWQEWAVYIGFALLLATGIAWLLLDKFVRVAGDFGPVPHPAEHLALVVHGIAAYGFLIVAGAMIPVHIRVGWNTRRNLKSGIGVVALLLFLTVSALSLYYVGNDAILSRVGLIHWLVGLIALPVLVIHVLGRGAAH